MKLINPTILGNLDFENSDKPLGGLNPYNANYTAIGDLFKSIAIEHSNLNNTSNVLDVGCGTGRFAKQCKNFVSKYVGLDNNLKFIEYCKRIYGEKRMVFDHLDVHHDEYNENGSIDPLSVVFPYSNKQFDLVISIAVFNHFRLSWIARYLQEISRVLKTNAYFLCTMFLINKLSEPVIGMKTDPPCSFKHRSDQGYYDFPDRELFNVAHDEIEIRKFFIQNNMMIVEPIKYGHWCLSKIALAGPDIIIAKKGQ